MRAILPIAAVVLAVALPAIAQAQGEDEQDNDRTSASMWRGGGSDHWHDGGGQWGDMDRQPGPQNMREMMMMRMASGLGEGTFYRFKRGNDEVDIRCSPREELQDCVKGATQLMKALPQGSSDAAATPSQQH